MEIMIAAPTKTNETAELFVGGLGVGLGIICAVLELTNQEAMSNKKAEVAEDTRIRK